MRFMTTAGLMVVGALALAVLLMGIVPSNTGPTGVEMGAAIAPMAAATTAPQPVATASSPVSAPKTNPNIASDPVTNPNIASDPETNPNIASDPKTNPNIAGDTTALLMATMVLLLLTLGLGATLLHRRRDVGARSQTVGSMAR